MALPIQITTRYLKDGPASNPHARISVLVSSLIQSVGLNIEHPWFPTIASFEIKLINDANIPALILDAVVANMKAYGYVFSEQEEEPTRNDLQRLVWVPGDIQRAEIMPLPEDEEGQRALAGLIHRAGHDGSADDDVVIEDEDWFEELNQLYSSTRGV